VTISSLFLEREDLKSSRGSPERPLRFSVVLRDFFVLIGLSGPIVLLYFLSSILVGWWGVLYVGDLYVWVVCLSVSIVRHVTTQYSTC